VLVRETWSAVWRRENVKKKVESTSTRVTVYLPIVVVQYKHADFIFNKIVWEREDFLYNTSSQQRDSVDPNRALSTREERAIVFFARGTTASFSSPSG
jgi:hypothetical protein